VNNTVDSVNIIIQGVHEICPHISEIRHSNRFKIMKNREIRIRSRSYSFKEIRELPTQGMPQMDPNKKISNKSFPKYRRRHNFIHFVQLEST